jgi:hypothetical protein
MTVNIESLSDPNQLSKCTMEDLLANLSKINDQISSYDSSTGDSHDALFVSCQDLLEGARAELRRSALAADARTKPTLKKVLSALMKTLRVQKRQSDAGNSSVVEQLMKEVDEITKELNSSGSTPTNGKIASTVAAASATPGLPTSAQEYQSRLVQHGKELYKHPPALPPPAVVMAGPVEVPPPQRDPVTRRLSFFMPFEDCTPKSGGVKRKAKSTAVLIPDFHPNVTPDEVLLGGAFGGTYFRDIHSAVTNISYKGTDVVASTLPPAWLEQFPPKARSKCLTSSVYRTSVNKFQVKCGGSLGMWEVRFDSALFTTFQLPSWHSHILFISRLVGSATPIPTDGSNGIVGSIVVVVPRTMLGKLRDGSPWRVRKDDSNPNCAIKFCSRRPPPWDRPKAIIRNNSGMRYRSP